MPRIIPRPWRSGRKLELALLSAEGLHGRHHAFGSERSTLGVAILVLAAALISTDLKQ